MELNTRLIIGHISWILLAVAMLLATRKWTGQSLCRYILLLPIGLGSLWSSGLHAFAPGYAAEALGWLKSPFQYEVAAAYLGLGIAGIASFRKSWDAALITTLVAFFFLEGVAYAHLLELFFSEDYTASNSGAILHAELVIPFLLAMALCIWKREIRQGLSD